MRFLVPSLLLVGLLSARTGTAAERPPSNFEARPIAMYVDLGLGGTPVGTVGFEAEVTLSRYLALSVGEGMGVAGPQLAAMPRLRLATTQESAMVLGVGVSNGNYAWTHMPFCILETCEPTIKRGHVTWANVEAGGEIRTDSGTSIRLVVGYGDIVRGSLTCVEPGTDGCDDHGRASWLVYLGAGVGWAF